jgi:hypothetical protein
MIRMIALSLLLLGACVVHAADNVFVLRVDKPVDAIYDTLYKSLEDAHFFVVLEPNIGKNISRFSERWGENYNRNELSAIRSMVFCNGWYANEVSNRDPEMLALCPLHLTLVEKDGSTRALFARPTVVGAGSPALEVLQELEADVIRAIREGMQ